jgi:hypothetical protein
MSKNLVVNDFVSPRIQHGQDAHATGLLLVALVLIGLPVFAQPVPTVRSISPDVLQRGATTKITIEGDHIADASQILVIGPPGVTATLKPAAAPTTKPAATVTFDITATSETSRGLREIRFITKNGVTKPLLLFVDDLPPIAEKEPNNSPGEAQPITLPAVITGKIQADLDVDCFKFDAKKGQRLIFDVQAFRSGSRLDASLSLFDSAGRRVAHDEDTNGLDPLIDFVLPADGQYTLRIQDLQYKGGPDFAYRIRAGELPYIDAIFPLGGQRGQQVAVQLKGRNLAGMKKMSMALDPSDPASTRQLEAPTPAGLSNPIPFAVSDLPEITEDTASAAPLAPPVVINGCISKPNETDTYLFKTPTAGPVVLAVNAARFGSRLDALLSLYDDKGALLQRNDDAPGTGADARIQFNAEANKTYKVTVRDLTEHGGDDYGYRLSIAPPRPTPPDFDVALPGSDGDVRLNRGGKTMLRAIVTRKGDFKSDITVTLFPLPPGVTCKPLVVPATQPSSGVFTLSATPEAQVGFHPLSVVATAMIGDEMITKTVPANPALRITPQVYLTVHESAPFRIERLGPLPDADPKKTAEQIAALEKELKTPTPQLEEAQAKWERSLNPANAWEVLEVTSAKSTSGAKLVKQGDGSLRAEGPVPNTDKYTITTKPPASPIRHLRLEAIAVGGKGPGRADNGNFVLSHFTLAAGADAPVAIASAKADFNQEGFPPADSINPKPDGGWAIVPETGKSHHVVYTLAAPLTPKPDATLTFTLDHSSKYAQHIIGHFRLLATASEKPDDATMLPASIAAVVRTPPEQRTKEQKDALAAYYRSIAPQLASPRGKLAALRSPKTPYPPVGAANMPVTVDITITRNPGFEGEITITPDGFSSGLDEKSKEPAPFGKNFEFQPMTLKPNQTHATMTFRPRPTVEKGTRDAILRAEANVNGAKYVVYSAPFPITVK